LDRAWVLERLMKNARIAMGEETVKLTLRKGNYRSADADSPATETVEITDRDAQAANKALELLGKTAELRMWVDQVEHGGAGEFSRMSDEELDQYIASKAQALTDGHVKH